MKIVLLCGSTVFLVFRLLYGGDGQPENRIGFFCLFSGYLWRSDDACSLDLAMTRDVDLCVTVYTVAMA